MSADNRGEHTLAASTGAPGTEPYRRLVRRECRTVRSDGIGTKQFRLGIPEQFPEEVASW